MQNILILASCAETQRIAYDHPSQTIDLVWNDTRLRLCPHEFYCMVRLLEMGVFELELTELRQENCRLQQRRLGYFQLYVNNMRLDLSLSDFLKLVTLARAAARQLNR